MWGGITGMAIPQHPYGVDLVGIERRDFFELGGVRDSVARPTRTAGKEPRSKREEMSRDMCGMGQLW
jgi:hypothetical protein